MDLPDMEFHPVIEEYVVDFAEENLTTTERDAFVEVLAVEDDLRQLAHSAKKGRWLMEQLRLLREPG